MGTLSTFLLDKRTGYFNVKHTLSQRELLTVHNVVVVDLQQSFSYFCILNLCSAAIEVLRPYLPISLEK